MKLAGAAIPLRPAVFAGHDRALSPLPRALAGRHRYRMFDRGTNARPDTPVGEPPARAVKAMQDDEFAS